MPPMYTLARDVNPSKTLWAMKLRLIRVYDAPGYGQRNMIMNTECVFHDEEGGRIHATIRANQREHYVERLFEGRLYALKNFVVTDNNMRYKTTTNKFKILFISQTRLTELLENSFPSILYDFVPIDKLLNLDDLDESKLIDIIARVISIMPPQYKNIRGGVTRMMDIVLEDAENNSISCTLWGEFVDEMMRIVEAGGPEPPVAILQFFRAKQFRGQVTVSNTFHASRMIFRVDTEEVKEFQRRLEAKSSVTTSISTVSLASGVTQDEDLAKGKVQTLSVRQLSEISEPGSYWVVASIVDIEDNEWCYLSCSKCLRKIRSVDGKLWCNNCNKHDVTGHLRYKIQVRVFDKTYTVPFILWDNVCIEIFGKSASDLKNSIIGKENESSLPEDVKSLLDKEYLFKVQVKGERVSGFQNAAFNVVKVCTDGDIISVYSMIDSQESDVLSKMDMGSLSKKEEVGSSGVEVNSPDKGCGSKSLSKEDTIGECKRILYDSFSSSEPLKRCKTVVKLEKD